MDFLAVCLVRAILLIFGDGVDELFVLLVGVDEMVDCR